MNVLRDIYNNSPYYFQSMGICVDSSQILVFPIFLCTGVDEEKPAELCFSEYVGWELSCGSESLLVLPCCCRPYCTMSLTDNCFKTKQRFYNVQSYYSVNYVLANKLWFLLSSAK